MASKTAVTQYRRKLRAKNFNKRARRARENKGTTPAFAIHTPEADAAAPVQAKKKK